MIRPDVVESLRTLAFGAYFFRRAESVVLPLWNEVTK